jgi:hypothetical protein
LALERFEERSVPTVNFAPAANYPAGIGSTFVVAAPLQGIPGVVDLAVSNGISNDVSVFLNNAGGSGTFQPAVSYPAGLHPYFLAVGDLFGDGNQDLVVSNDY